MNANSKLLSALQSITILDTLNFNCSRTKRKQLVLKTLASIIHLITCSARSATPALFNRSSAYVTPGVYIDRRHINWSSRIVFFAQSSSVLLVSFYKPDTSISPNNLHLCSSEPDISFTQIHSSLSHLHLLLLWAEYPNQLYSSTSRLNSPFSRISQTILILLQTRYLTQLYSSTFMLSWVIAQLVYFTYTICFFKPNTSSSHNQFNSSHRHLLILQTGYLDKLYSSIPRVRSFINSITQRFLIYVPEVKFFNQLYSSTFMLF